VSSSVEGVTQVRDTTGLAAALEAVLFTLNRAVTVLELQDILQSPLPRAWRKRWRAAVSFCNAIRTNCSW